MSLAPSRELQAELAAVKRREENGEATRHLNTKTKPSIIEHLSFTPSCAEKSDSKPVFGHCPIWLESLLKADFCEGFATRHLQRHGENRGALLMLPSQILLPSFDVALGIEFI